MAVEAISNPEGARAFSETSWKGRVEIRLDLARVVISEPSVFDKGELLNRRAVIDRFVVNHFDLELRVANS